MNKCPRCKADLAYEKRTVENENLVITKHYGKCFMRFRRIGLSWEMIYEFCDVFDKAKETK